MCVMSFTLAARADVTFYVAVDGDDMRDGRSPATAFKTFQQAVTRVETFRAENPGKETVTVEFGDGTYFLDEMVWVTPGVSGQPGGETIFKAAQGATPVFSGGVKITGWRVNEKGHWEAALPVFKDADGNALSWRPTQLFVDGQRRFRPRMPKQGYYTVTDTVPPTQRVKNNCMDRFRFGTVKNADGTETDEIRPDMTNLDQIEVVALSKWTAARLPVQEVDAAEKIVTFTGQTRAPHTSFMKGHPYFLENVRDALSDPGEWYYDMKENLLTYIPREGETPENTEVIVPRVKCLMAVGYGEEKKLERVYFEALTFMHAGWEVPAEGLHEGQGEVGVIGAINVVNAANCGFGGCAVLHCGGYGMALSLGCQRNIIEACDFADLGAGGIRIGKFWAGVPDVGIPFNVAKLGDMYGENAYVTHHGVSQCTMAHCGRMHPAGIGVMIGHASNCAVSKCDIYDFYYSATSVGWSWGYQPSQAHHNRVEWCHMHTLGQGVLSDMGGVYTLGVSPGTVIENNRIHDVKSYDYGGWGLYTDEGSTGIVMRNNTVFRTKSASFHQHYGKENVIENNIFVNGLEQQLQRSREEDHLSFKFLRNVVYWESAGRVFGSTWRNGNYELDYNVYFNPNHPLTYPDSGGAVWGEQKKDEHSVIADPLFVDAANDDYRLKPDSPAFKLGFKPLPEGTPGRTVKSKVLEKMKPVPAGFSDPRK